MTAGLIITYECNLNCVYCYEKNKKSLYMSVKAAKEILEPLLQESGEPLQIMLMGGEPLLAFQLIKELVEWSEETHERWKRSCFFFGSTNGTLLDDDMKYWFHIHREQVILALSFDGIPIAQNINRCLTADCIDLEFFGCNWPEQKIQMTISEETVSRMAEGIIFLLEKGFSVNPSVAYESHEWKDQSVQEYLKQLLIIKDYYLIHLDAPIIYQLSHPLIDYAKELDTPTTQKQQCGAGCGFVMFDIDKEMYPCHMLSPLVLSKEQLQKIQRLNLEKQIFQDERCIGCPYISACSTCMGCNYLYWGDFKYRDSTHCKIQQIEVLVTIRYWVSLFDKNPMAGSKEMAEAICTLSEYTGQYLH